MLSALDVAHELHRVDKNLVHLIFTILKDDRLLLHVQVHAVFVSLNALLVHVRNVLDLQLTIGCDGFDVFHLDERLSQRLQLILQVVLLNRVVDGLLTKPLQVIIE